MEETHNSNVNDHLSTSQLQAIAFGQGASDEYENQVQHIASCEQCHLQFTEALEPKSSVSTFSLEPESWFQHDHLHIGELTNLADDTVDDESRSICDIHLRSCERCRESFVSILALRAEQKPEGLLPFAITSRSTSSMAYLIAAMALVAFTALTVLILLSQRSKSSSPKTAVAQPTSVDESATGSPVKSQAAGSPEKEDEILAVLNDGPGPIEIYKSGHIRGPQGVSWSTSQEISRLLLTSNFRYPNVLKELAPDRASLRGPGEQSGYFKLIYPARQVIIDTRPRFRWQHLAGASSYQVFVVNSDGKECARSEVLKPNQLHWTPQNSLPRGKLFSWSVVAVIDQTEFISPPPSETEMKFAILSEKDKRELSDLKQTQSHLAKGLFFARTGLLAEAENEFIKLAQLNPRSPIPGQLLNSLHEAK